MCFRRCSPKQYPIRNERMGMSKNRQFWLVYVVLVSRKSHIVQRGASSVSWFMYSLRLSLKSMMMMPRKFTSNLLQEIIPAFVFYFHWSNLFASNQFLTSSINLLAIVWNFYKSSCLHFLTFIRSEVSLGYKRIVPQHVSCRQMKNKGPKIKPLGTPWFMSLGRDRSVD